MLNALVLFSEPIAKRNGCATVRNYTGHGINGLFHATPNIPHYAKNKAIGTMKPGMVCRHTPLHLTRTKIPTKVFTIEPVRSTAGVPSPSTRPTQ